MHKLVLIKKGVAPLDITQYCNSLAWGSELNSLSTQLGFNYVYNDAVVFKKLDVVTLGDHIIFSNGGKKLGTFVIVSESYNGRFGKSFTCNDYGWYLNKNKTIIQFNKTSASSAIAKLLDRFGIKHNLVNIKTLINKVFKDQVISDIINDILEQAAQETGHKYYYEMINDTFVLVDRLSNTLSNLTIDLGYGKINILDTISAPSHSRNIVELKNSILVVSGEEKAMKIFAPAMDEVNISRYGLLQEIVSVDSKQLSQARNIANNKLKERNKVIEDISIELLGHDDIRAGRLIEISEPVTKIKGIYLIKSASHTENNGIHKVSMQLEVA